MRQLGKNKRLEYCAAQASYFDSRNLERKGTTMHGPVTLRRVLLLNNISEAGIKALKSEYECGDRVNSPHALLVRSASVDTDDYPTILAIARAGTGVNKISLDKASMRGIPVFYTPGANANSVAELTFALIVSAARNVFGARTFVSAIDGTLSDSRIDELVESHKKPFVGFELVGKTIAVIGMGNVGRLVAAGALARGMSVKAFDPYVEREVLEQMDPRIERCDLIRDAVRDAHIVSVHVTLTSDTRGLVNAVAIAGMKRGAILVNMSREAVCNEPAVLEALDSGRTGMFITDFPTSKTHAHPKVICMPHLGASTEEAEERSASMASRQLIDFFKYGVVTHAVNFPDMRVMPRGNHRMRLAIPHKNVPGIIAAISDKLRDAGVNIAAVHSDTRGDLGYCVADLESVIGHELIESIGAMSDILKVLPFKFF